MHAVTSFALAVACVVAGLALAAAVADLALEVGVRNDGLDPKSPFNLSRFDTAALTPSYHTQAGEPLWTQHAIGALSPESLTPDTTNSAPKSPLYPQNGVTLWDRIRVSSKRDRRAFLLGVAIQIHAPATAATPGPRSDPPPCCPRS